MSRPDDEHYRYDKACSGCGGTGSLTPDPSEEDHAALDEAVAAHAERFGAVIQPRIRGLEGETFERVDETTVRFDPPPSPFHAPNVATTLAGAIGRADYVWIEGVRCQIRGWDDDSALIWPLFASGSTMYPLDTPCEIQDTDLFRHSETGTCAWPGCAMLALCRSGNFGDRLVCADHFRITNGPNPDPLPHFDAALRVDKLAQLRADIAARYQQRQAEGWAGDPRAPSPLARFDAAVEEKLAPIREAVADEVRRLRTLAVETIYSDGAIDEAWNMLKPAGIDLDEFEPLVRRYSALGTPLFSASVALRCALDEHAKSLAGLSPQGRAVRTGGGR